MTGDPNSARSPIASRILCRTNSSSNRSELFRIPVSPSTIALSSDPPSASPFFRNYGPDLTGMFLGDCGAFGIKTAITLQLIPTAKEEAYASFSFDDPAAQMGAMAQIGAELLASECSGIDPFTARTRMASQGFLSDLKTIGQVVQVLEVSEQTFHRWRKQYGGKQLRPPTDEGGRRPKAVVL